MSDATTHGPPARRRTWVLRGALTTGAALLLVLGGIVSLTKPFQQGATRLFSKVVDGVKDHPRATLAIVLVSVLLLWLAIGAIAATQELRSKPANRDGGAP